MSSPTSKSSSPFMLLEENETEDSDSDIEDLKIHRFSFQSNSSLGTVDSMDTQMPTNDDMVSSVERKVKIPPPKVTIVELNVDMLDIRVCVFGGRGCSIVFFVT